MALRTAFIAANCIFLAVICDATRAQPSKPWPIMRTFTKTMSIDMRSPKQLLTILLPDQEGRSTYKLVCFSGNENAVQAEALIYSGGLLCGLASVRTPNDWLFGNRSLLSDGITAAIYSRGNFNPEEIVGACAMYPEFGRVRNFRLRGFALSLKLSDVEVDPTYFGGPRFRTKFDNKIRNSFPIGKLRLTVSVAPSPASRSNYAAPVGVRDPKGDQGKCIGIRRLHQ